jgi:hypothetical protein
MKNSADEAFAKLKELLGEPTLMACDDSDQYEALQKAVERLVKPKDLFDTLEASDLVDAISDVARFKAHSAELVNIEWRKALKKLADPEAGYVSRKAGKAIQAHLDAGGAMDGMAESILLRKSGLGRASVEAHAILLVGEGFSAMNELVSSRTATRNALIKACRKKIAAKAKKQAAKEKKLAAKKKAAAKPENDWL